MTRRRKTLDTGLRRTLWGFAAVVVTILVLAWAAFSQPLDANHPELAWMTMETEHFIIHYHEGSRRTALVIAKIAEEIHPRVTKLYGYEPDTKFHFIVKDTDDYANGAAYYYNNKMVIWATPLDYDLRGTSDWLRNVITHEYTHIIQLGAARKMSRQLPAIYLQVLAYEEEKRPDVLYGYPNILASYPFAQTIVPMWFAEGTAQYNHPALRYDFWDSHRDMQLRTRALEDRLLPLNEMEVFGKNSLGNEGVYNHGFSLVRYIAQTWSEDTLATLTREAARIGRYDFNAVIERVLGISGEELHLRWKTELKQDYLADTKTIRAHLVTGDTLLSEGTANLYPRIGPDSTLYVSSNMGMDYFGQRSIWAFRKGEEPELIVKMASGPFDISPDGRWIVYSNIVRQRNESYFADLYLYDTVEEEKIRLTTNARAMEPSFAPDLSSVVCLLNHDGIKDVVRFDLPPVDLWEELDPVSADEAVRLSDFGDGRRAYRPRYSPSGDSILYAESRHVGRDLMIMAADGSGARTVAGGDGDQRDGAWTGERTVVFSSDVTGIFNLYRLNLDSGERTPLTNVLGGAVQPAPGPDGSLAYAGWTVDGYAINLIEEPRPVDEAHLDYGRDYLAAIPPRTFDDAEPDSFETHPYRPIFEQLFFVPRIAFDYGTFKPGLYVYSSDFLEKLMLFGGFDINRHGEFDAVSFFDFKALRPTLFIEGYYLRREDNERFDDPYVIVDERFDEDGNLVPVYDTYGVDYAFNLMLVEGGARMRLFTPLELELRASLSRYDASMTFEDETDFRYTYFKGRYYQAQFRWDGMLPQVHGNVHPKHGSKANLTLAWEDNDFIEGFEVNEDKYTLQEVFSDYRYWRLEGDGTLWWNPVGELVAQPRLRFGWLSEQVDPFMHLYAGGLHGMRGYSFYSMGGTRTVIGSLALRHPIWTPDRPRFGWLHFDGLYGGIFGDVGDAWRERDFEPGRLKSDLGLELRAKFFSWYGYPTAVTFSAARGFDEVTVRENDYTTVYDPQWRYYLTVLFEFETIFPSRGTTIRRYR